MSYIDNMRTAILRIKTTKEKVKDAEKALKDEKYFEDRINKDAERDEDLFKHNCTRIQEGYIRVPFCPCPPSLAVPSASSIRRRILQHRAFAG